MAAMASPLRRFSVPTPASTPPRCRYASLSLPTASATHCSDIELPRSRHEASVRQYWYFKRRLTWIARVRASVLASPPPVNIAMYAWWWSSLSLAPPWPSLHRTVPCVPRPRSLEVEVDAADSDSRTDTAITSVGALLISPIRPDAASQSLNAELYEYSDVRLDAGLAPSPIRTCRARIVKGD
ncbi:hypothetical protein FB451DRAFT_1551115 [Mycena latifolia]|nr:hypothetical protein FB451DRAFT_1551115 [Mycena latifolia]